MDVQAQILAYIAAQSEQKRNDLQTIHEILVEMIPNGKLWFISGKDDSGRTVSNPSIGYGTQTMTYADGKTRDFYQIGTSANSAGISVYVMGLKDKKYLAEHYRERIGKASVTGYCIKFKTLAAIELGTLVDAMRDGLEQTAS